MIASQAAHWGLCRVYVGYYCGPVARHDNCQNQSRPGSTGCGCDGLLGSVHGQDMATSFARGHLQQRTAQHAHTGRGACKRVAM